MEALGLTEALVWEAELASLSLKFDLHCHFTQLFCAPKYWRSPRLVANLVGITIALFSPILPSFIHPTFLPEAIAQTSTCNNILLKRDSPQTTAVKSLQTSLKARGYSLGVDGIFGSNTEAILKSFQRSSGLTADGIYGAQTCKALTGTTSSKPSSSFDNQLSSVNSGASSTTKASDTNVAIGTLTTTRFGDKNDKVRSLQNTLRLLGYTNVSNTGVFDQATDIAVRDFQKQTGLSQDGIVGNNTASRLIQALNRGEIYRLSSSNTNGASAIARQVTTNPVMTNEQARYIVAVPSRSSNTLNTVRQYVPGAQLQNSRRGSFVHAGSTPNRQEAESLSYGLRAFGIDARVISQ